MRDRVRTALALYRGGTFGLEGAADYCGASPDEFAAALRARGIGVREGERERDRGRATRGT